MNLIKYILEAGIKTPVKLEIGLDKLQFDRSHNGNDVRYMSCFITANGKRVDVTPMVSEATGFYLSKASDTYNSIIVKGSGSDMGYEVVYRLCSHAFNAGYPDMFVKDYKYLGKRSKGKYPFEKGESL